MRTRLECCVDSVMLYIDGVPNTIIDSVENPDYCAFIQWELHCCLESSYSIHSLLNVAFQRISDLDSVYNESCGLTALFNLIRLIREYNLLGDY